MKYNMPSQITSEKDLKQYEKFLEYDISEDKDAQKGMCQVNNKTLGNKIQIENRNIVPDTLTNPLFFQGYLKNHIGKLIKVESLIGNCLESRIGKLLEIGADYVVIKLYQSSCSMMINTAPIKYITIVHDNDVAKAIYK